MNTKGNLADLHTSYLIVERLRYRCELHHLRSSVHYYSIMGREHYDELPRRYRMQSARDDVVHDVFHHVDMLHYVLPEFIHYVLRIVVQDQFAQMPAHYQCRCYHIGAAAISSQSCHVERPKLSRSSRTI